MTTLAPPPGRETEPDGEGDAGSGGHEVVVLPDPAATTTPSTTSTVSVTSSNSANATVDLTPRRSKPPARDPAAQAAWVFGLALALLSEGVAERVVMAEVLAEAAGRSPAIEGAYGRAVALLSEFPGDPLVYRTIDLLAKALLRSRRPARTAEEA